MTKYFFTSDTHFSHKNIIKYAKRPFANADEMNETMIERWNDTVGLHDIVYHVGDIAFEKDRHKLRHMLARLHGKKHAVWGNHDRGLWQTAVEAGFHNCGDLHTVNVPPECNNGVRQKIILCHYAMRVWNESHYGSWHLYGHSHGSLADDKNALSLDVGVDCWDFTPVSMEQLNAAMAKKIWKPIDHHHGHTRSDNNED